MAQGRGEKRLYLLGWLVVVRQKNSPQAPSQRAVLPIACSTKAQLRGFDEASEPGVRRLPRWNKGKLSQA